jgi:hypothetical protein
LHAAGSRLQSSTQLDGPWSDVRESPTVVGNEYALALPIVAGSRFFRLTGP